MIIDLEALVALILEFKRLKRPFREFEILLYEAACNYVSAQLKERLDERTENST